MDILCVQLSSGWSAPDAPDAEDQPLISPEVRAREEASRTGHDDGRIIRMLGMMAAIHGPDTGR